MTYATSIFYKRIKLIRQKRSPLNYRGPKRDWDSHTGITHQHQQGYFIIMVPRVGIEPTCSKRRLLRTLCITYSTNGAKNFYLSNPMVWKKRSTFSGSIIGPNSVWILEPSFIIITQIINPTINKIATNINLITDEFLLLLFWFKLVTPTGFEPVTNPL